MIIFLALVFIAFAHAAPPEAQSERARPSFLACRSGDVDACSAFIALLDAEPELERDHRAALLGEALYSRGHAALHKGYSAKAALDFSRLLEVQPNALAAHLAVADAWSAGGESERAIALFTRVLKQRAARVRLPPRVRALVLVRRANAFAEMKEHSLALKDFEAALQLDASAPSAMAIHRNRALSYALLGNASFAIDDLNKLVQLQSQRAFVEPEAYFLRAMCFALQHQHVLAIKDFDRTFEVNAKLKRRPWTDPSTGRTHTFSGSLEVRVEQQRAAVQKSMRSARVDAHARVRSSEELSEEQRNMIPLGWRTAASVDELPPSLSVHSSHGGDGVKPLTHLAETREAEIASILQQHYQSAAAAPATHATHPVAADAKTEL